MSWVHRLGNYAGYLAKNYVSRNADKICHTTLQREINHLIKNPRIIPSVLHGKEYSGFLREPHPSPSYGKPSIYQYGYLDRVHYPELANFEKGKLLWKNVPMCDKLEIFEKIANLVEDKYYYKLIAATMVGQGKNFVEAELDAIAETVDFLRFNIQYTSQICEKQPIGDMNYSQYLPLQGRVAAITPFNFTAIAANLSTAPLYFGNTVFWKPSEKSLLSNYLFYQICLEAGLPPEVLHFVIMKPEDYIQNVIRDRTGGVLFTGSTQAFTNILGKINYQQHFPRIIGETGGKNFHFVEKTADLDLVVEKTYQSAYGYSGQKCSACSILYLPDFMIEDFKDKFRSYHENVHTKDEKEKYCLIGKDSYERTVKILENIKNDPTIDVLMGGSHDDKNGYYVEPTLCRVGPSKTSNSLTEKELFAPILCLKHYHTNFTNMALMDCAKNSEYKLTGAIFSKDTEFINSASEYLDNSCGNFYINDKSTGSVVGQQPFGGFGKSGTNDKAGDINFMMRLFSQRNIKYNSN